LIGTHPEARSGFDPYTAVGVVRRRPTVKKQLAVDEAAHEKRNKDTDNFLVTVGIFG
jgi:hypothetical protein